MMDIHFPSDTNVITSHRRGRNRCVLNRCNASFRKAIGTSAVALLIGVLLGGTVERVAAQDTSSTGCQITDLQIGIKNHFRLGCWTQVRMSLQSPNAYAKARVEMELPDGEGMRCVYVTRDVPIPVGESHVVSNLKVGRTDSSFKVRIFADDQLVAEKDYLPDDLPDGVFGSQFLVLTLGSDLGVRETISQRREDDSEQTVSVQVTDVDQLPSQWLGYGGVNVIVVPTSLQSVAAQMSAMQVDALKTWVRMGGRIILSGGAESEPIFQAGGKLAELLPGKFDGVRMQRETSNFEGYAGKTRLSLSSFPRESDATFRLPMAVISDATGSVELYEGLGSERTPAIIRSSYGFGHVLFLAVDLDLAPVARWKDGRRRVLKRLIDMCLGEQKRDDVLGQYSQMTQIGFADLTGQLRGALDQFSDSGLVPFSWIACLIGLYIVLIGPVDYFLLRRWKQRFGLTWFTFPLTVLAASLFAVWLTQTWKGQQLTINQATILDVDYSSQTLRGNIWAHVFSPVNRKYDCDVQVSTKVLPSVQASGNLASWQGLVGAAFGGMQSRQRQSDELSYQVSQTQDARTIASQVQELPIGIYGSRSLHGTSWGAVQLEEIGEISYDIDKQLSGTIQNPLPVALKNCQLYFGRRVYALPSLAPGGSQDVSQSVPKAIEMILTKKQVNQDLKDVSQPWDRMSFDLDRILQMMMFYKAAGGKGYTSLLHRFQPEVDLSDHLNQERAILVGKVAEPGMVMLQDEPMQVNANTYVRILLPVTKVEGRRGINRF